jgi:hypothetical protein
MSTREDYNSAIRDRMRLGQLVNKTRADLSETEAAFNQATIRVADTRELAFQEFLSQDVEGDK